MKYLSCRKCEAANQAGAKYCRECGAVIGTETSKIAEIGYNTGSRRALVETEVVAIPPPQAVPADPQMSENGSDSVLARLLGHQPEPAADNPDHPADGNPGVSAVRELARASGLSEHSRFSPTMRTLAAGLALLLTFCAWLIYRDQSQASAEKGRGGMNLVGADETSNRLTLTGEHLRDQGDFEEAIAQFREALKLTPHNVKAQALLARTYNAVGRVDEALQAYTKLLETDPKNLEARLQRAEIYRVRGEWSEAAREYRRIIELDPGSEQAQVALDAIEKPTAERSASYSMLPAMRRRNENKAGIKYLPPAADHSRISLPMAELAPNSLPSALPGGTASDSETEAELAGYRNSIALTYKNRGNLLSNAGRYADAIRAYQNAQRYTPDDDDLEYLIGTSFFKSGQYSVALEHYRRCRSGVYAAVAKNSVRKAEEEARRLAKKQAKQKS